MGGQTMCERSWNLSRLHEQLQSKKLQEILTVLEHAKSGWLKKFRALEEDIKNGSIEAKERSGGRAEQRCGQKQHHEDEDDEARHDLVDLHALSEGGSHFWASAENEQ
eukprot:Skav230098  [mRNA]  locus=scaffold283:76783:78654:- [translate_table: standard]